MSDMLKRLKTNTVFNAILYVIVGAVLLIYPGVAADLVCYVLGGILILCGLVDLLLSLRHRDGSLYTNLRLGAGVVLTAVGIWVMFQQRLIFSVVPWIIGALIVIHALHDLRLALELRKNQSPRWGGALLVSAVTLVLGIVLITTAFETALMTVRFIGVFLLVDGLSDLWVAFQVYQSRQKQLTDTAANDTVVDVEYTEVPEDKPADETDPKQE